MSLEQILSSAYTHWAKITTGNLTVSNEDVILVDKTSGAATTITLPPALGGLARRLIIIIDAKGDAGTNNITVNVAGSGTINGLTSFVIRQNAGTAMFVDVGDEWQASGGTVASSGAGAGTSMAFANTVASTAVVGSTTAEQAFDVSYTIPANTLKAGTVVKVRAQGIATTTTSTDGLAYKIYIGGTGGTALITSASADPADGATFLAETTLVCRTAGTTGTFVSTGTYKQVSAEGTMTVKDDITGSTTINTQANQAIVVTATWSVANATNSCRLDILTVEIS